MFSWLTGTHVSSTPSYRIRNIPGHGFIPEVYCDVVLKYQVIEKDLTIGVYEGSVTS